MFTQEQAGTVMGGTLYGTGGDKIGKIGQVFVDDSTGRPEWVTVHTGLFGTNESFVPIANADPSGGHLSEQEEEELYRYYGMSGADTGTYAGTGGTTEGTYSETRTTGFREGDVDSGVDTGVSGTDVGVGTGVGSGVGTAG